MPAHVDLQQFRYLFFFSYARLDQDVYLQRFFDDLSDAVRLKSAHAQPSFRDMREIGPGEDWPKELVDALQHSQTLLCIYSPSYFQRVYCGKEVTVFLQRQGVLQDEQGVARGSERIIPVLWLREQDLQRLGLPPAMLRAIQYSVTNHTALYIERGLRGILRRGGRRAAYFDIIDELADIIIDRSMTALPPLTEVPDLDQVPSAFMPAPPPVRSGPGVLRVFRVGPAAAAAADPTSAAGSLHQHLSDVALQLGMQSVFEAVTAAAAGSLTADLRTAAARNESVLVLADAAEVFQAEQDVLREAAASADWKGGILILDDGLAGAGAALADSLLASRPLRPEEAERVVVKAVAPGAPTFAAALTGFVSLLKRRAVGSGAAYVEVAGAGPDHRPLVAGPRAGAA